MNRFNRALTTLGYSMVAVVAVRAQETTGQLRGTVRDPAGKPLVDVRLEITSAKMMQARVLQTNERGDYRAPLLPLGDYKIILRKTGYISVAISNIHVSLGKMLYQDVVLHEEKIATAVVEVVAIVGNQDKSVVNTQSTYTADVMESLPANDRNLESAAALAPGVSANRSGDTSIRGGTALDTLFLLDNTDISESVTGRPVSSDFYVADAIEAFQIISSPINARYGSTTGGIVNAVTKAGGNEFEGILRLNAGTTHWNARRPMGPWRPHVDVARGNAPSVGVDTLYRAWSVFLSGPILKDRLWFSVSTKLDPDRTYAHALSVPSPFLYDYYTTRDRSEWYGSDYPGYLGSNRPFYAGPNPGMRYDNITNNQFYGFNLTGSITANHTLTLSGSKTEFSETNHQYVTSADARTLVAQSERAQYVSLAYRGVLSPGVALEVNIAKKFKRFVGGSDLAKGPLVYAIDFTGQPWLFNNGIFNNAQPDDRDTRTINANLSLFQLDVGHFGQHTLELGGEFKTRTRRAANLQSPTGTSFYALGSWLDAEATQRFIMRPHDPRIEDPATPEDLRTQLKGQDLDPAINTYVVQEYGSDLPTKTNMYSLHVNDTITLSDRWQVMAGLRYDRTDVADTFGNPTIKNTAISPRFQVSYDPLGNQRYLFRASWARFTGSLPDAFTNKFALAGNPIREYYVWQAPAGDTYTLADVINLTNWNFSRNGLVYIEDPSAGNRVNHRLKCPSNDEVSVSFRYNAQDGSSLSVTYAQRRLKNAIDSTVLATRGSQFSSRSVSYPDYVLYVPGYNYANSDQVKRDYKSLEIEFNSVITSHFSLSGNYTYSILKGNGNLEDASSTALGYFPDVHAAMGHPVDYYAPYGNLGEDNRHKATLWGTYSIGTKQETRCATTLMLSYLGGGTSGLNRNNVFDAQRIAFQNGLQHVGSYPVSYLRYFSPRGFMRNNDVYRFDLKVNLDTPIGKRIIYFVAFSVFNLFNHVQLSDLSFETEDMPPGADGSPTNAFLAKGLYRLNAPDGRANTYGFGTYGGDNFTNGRSLTFSTGFRW